MIQSKILFAFSICLLFLQLSCRVSEGMSKSASVSDSNEEPVFEEVSAGLEPSLGEDIEVEEEEKHPPVCIEGGNKNRVLYAKMPNRIKIYVKGENTSHLSVKAMGGKIEVIDTTKGLYSFYEDKAGLRVEIIAEDLKTGEKAVETFSVMEIPAPEAYVWKYRMPFQSQFINFTANDFRTQNAIVLYYNVDIPNLCTPSSYTMIRVDGKGNRTAVVNENPKGMFDEEAKKLISVAEKGDLYIFKDIKTACTTKDVKNIVYAIE